MISKLRGRSPQEISFRLQQESHNLAMYLWAPSPGGAAPGALPVLPNAAKVAKQLSGTLYSIEVERLAGEILTHRFPLLGYTLTTGPEIDWRRDYENGITSPLKYWRRVPYLDIAAVGDHKNVWELNRHQHLALLAQAFLLTGKREYVIELIAQLESWMAANPFARGVNWTSALEVAFRTLSWTWIWHLVSGEMSEPFRARLLAGIYRHGCYLERNLSVYFSPNTHLLGESVALHALGVLFPQFPRSAKWVELGRSIVAAQMARQVREDGSHFEQSTYYHVYALDMFLFHLLLEPNVSPEYLKRAVKMAEYLNALLGPAREIEYIGDDDGGRFFHPFGNRRQFGRGTLAVASALLGEDYHYHDEEFYEVAAWWTGKPPSHSKAQPFSGSAIFRDAGMMVESRGDAQFLFKYGPMGDDSGGHSHADLLSVTLRDGDERILVDPGTFTYVGDPGWRDWFRSTGAHNTVMIDGLDQAVTVNPFRWSEKPESALESHESLAALCKHNGFVHRRRLVWKDAAVLIVVDEVEGPLGDHLVEQIWHVGVPLLMLSPACFQLGRRAKFWANPDTSREFGEGGDSGWTSPAFGVKEPGPVLRVMKRGALPVRLVAVLDLEGRYSEWQAEWSGV